MVESKDIPSSDSGLLESDAFLVADEDAVGCVATTFATHASSDGARLGEKLAEGEFSGGELAGDASLEPEPSKDVLFESASSESTPSEDAQIPRRDVLHFDMNDIASYGKNARAAKASRPDPRVVVLPDFCLNPHGGACKRCVFACPAQAVSLTGVGGLPEVDAQVCTMCGICLGICDAFTSNDITMTDLASRIRRAAQLGEGVFLTCPKNIEAMEEGCEPAACVVTVPCLAALSPEFWTLVLADVGDVKIACDLGLCAECALGGNLAESLYTHSIETAQSWSGHDVDVVDEVPVKTGYLQSFVTAEEMDRRGVFSHFAGNVTDAASGEYRKRNSTVLQEFYERQERMRAQTRQIANPLPELNRFNEHGRTRKTLPPKRKMLLDAIARDAAIAARVAVVVSRTDCAACENALACAGVCPTGAREPHPDNGLLTFDARFCIGCGLCVDACGAAAIELVEETAEVFANYVDGAHVECSDKLREWEEMQAARAARKACACKDKVSEAT